MRSPDRWAKETGRRNGGVAPWWHSVPNDVRKLVQSSSLGAGGLVEWFHSEVAAAYPGESWPAEATKARCERLIEAVRRATA